MSIKRVAVFGATGFQGKAQLGELVRQGFTPVAVCRNPVVLDRDPQLADVERRAADYDDEASLDQALLDVDAIFFQAPAVNNMDRLLEQCARLTDAIARSAVQVTIVNSSMWAPDAPCGEVVYDGVLAMEEVFAKSGIAVTFFRPTLFMNNLLGDWIREQITDQGVYFYPHKAEMQANWIALEDVAKFMIAALGRPDLIGKKIRIGGPERLTTLQMLEIMSDILGRPIKHQYMEPRAFGEYFWSLFGQSSGMTHDDYVASWDSFYHFNNEAPQKPFEVDPTHVRAVLPIELMTLRDWAAQQDWRVQEGISK